MFPSKLTLSQGYINEIIEFSAAINIGFRICLSFDLRAFFDSSQYRLTMFRLRQLNYRGVLQQKGFYIFQARVGAFSNVVAQKAFVHGRKV